MPDYGTEVELLKLRMSLAEQQIQETKADVHKIVGQLSNIKTFLIIVLVVVSPQSVTSIIELIKLIGGLV